MPKLRFAAIVAFALLGASCGRTGHAPMGAVELRRELETAGRRYLDALKRSDATEAASLYTEDGTLLQPGLPVVKGRERIRQALHELMRLAPLEEGALVTLEADLDGDLAYERGDYSFAYHPPGRAVQIVTGKYLYIWKRQKDGSWKLHVDCGLPNPTPRAAAPAARDSTPGPPARP